MKKKKKADLPFRIHLKTDACAFHRQRMLINIVPLYIQLYLCSDDQRPNLLGACKRSLPHVFCPEPMMTNRRSVN